MNSQESLPEEKIKNLDSRIKISCSQCKAEHTLDACLQQESVSSPYGLVIEALIVCPECGLRTHSYYLSEPTRQQRTLLYKAIAAYQQTRTKTALNQMVLMRKRYTYLFDKDQQRFGEIMAKSKVQNEPE